MKTKQLILSILTLFGLNTCIGQNPEIVRGPYIQNVTTSSVLIHWRTNTPTPSILKYANNFKKNGKIIADNTLKTEHEITISNLKTNTKYFYSIVKSKNEKFTDSKQYFKANPKIGSTQPIRIWALGDFGNSSPNQMKVRDAIVKYTENQPVDVWIWQGDNAYSYGRDEEYQKHVFPHYQKDFFKNTTLYPSPGNHDYAGKHDSSLPPYFNTLALFY